MKSPCSMLSLSSVALLSCSSVDAFAPPRSQSLRACHHPCAPLSSLPPSERHEEAADATRPPPPFPTRRGALRRSAAAVAAGLSTLAGAPSRPASALPPLAIFSNPFVNESNKSNGGTYVPAKRCTAYLVDATIPPSLIPYRAGREAAILKSLGRGGGTSKAPMVEDDVNLNNFMNRAVFGTLDAAKAAAGLDSDRGPTRAGPHFQSFVFLGADFDDTDTAAPDRVNGATNADADLAVELLTDLCRPRERDGNTALGLAFAPTSAGPALDAYLADAGDAGAAERALVTALAATGADAGLAEKHLPLFRFAKRRRVALLPLAPEAADLATVRGGGLQALDARRRDAYVADAAGFVALTQEPKFKLYTDKSLLKDFHPALGADEAAVKAGSAAFFAERILVHEAGATAVARWASGRPDALVVALAPVADVRFLGGINGRVPRVSQALDPASLVDAEAVTTILLNPSARETLSESRWLRLEIGTAPNNWTYQTKVADYLWFSSMPKVNMLPRMMNEM